MKILLIPTVSQKGSTSDLRRRDWPIKCWIELHKLIGDTFDSYLLVHNDVAHYFVNERDVIPGNSTDQLFNEVNAADVIIACDSGPLHIADALGKVTIGLFGPTNSSIFAGAATSIIQQQIYCSPCHDGIRFAGDCHSNKCMQKIQPLTVMKYLEKELDNVRLRN